MDWSPKLQRQRSCACPGLEIGSWCYSRRRTAAGFSRRFTESDCEDEFDQLVYAARASWWRGLWRRIVKEKRRILNSAAPIHLPYDPYTYAQNFDDGSATWVEPENLSRSFSARFADPTRILQRVG